MFVSPNTTHVTRYAITRTVADGSKFYLMACYEPEMDGIAYTHQAMDACQYVSIDKAASVSRQLAAIYGHEFEVCIVNK